MSSRTQSRTNIRLVDKGLTLQLAMEIEEISELYPSLYESWLTLESQGWILLAADQTRGWCNCTTKTIQIPKWVISKGIEYLTYYLAHEMAHAFAYKTFKCIDHGSVFMEVFMTLCPEHLQFHELDYKPNNAKAAGISQKKSQLRMEDIVNINYNALDELDEEEF